MARTESKSSEVQAGSSLASDDAATARWHLSHAALSGLSHGIDHLHCFRNLVLGARVLHPYAPFSLLRSAVENLATAVWLLAPEEGVDRVQRRLQLARADAARGEEVRQMVGAPVGRPLETRLEEMASAAIAPGVPRDSAYGKAPGFERIVREAGEATRLKGDTLVMVWKTCSGITHGQLWASFGVLTREMVPDLDDPESESVHLKLSAPESTLQLATECAVVVGKEAWRLFDNRRLKFTTHQ